MCGHFGANPQKLSTTGIQIACATIWTVTPHMFDIMPQQPKTELKDTKILILLNWRALNMVGVEG